MSREALMSEDAVAEVRAMLEARGAQLRSYELKGDTLHIRVVPPAYTENMQIELHFDEPVPAEVLQRYAGCSCDWCLKGTDCGCAWCTKEHARAEAYAAETREVDL